MTVIGLTGKVCAGKNQYAELLERSGAEVIDVDRLGHRVLEEQTAAVVARFGPSVAVDGVVDRSALARIVFSDGAALAALEGIVHPAMVEACRKIITESTKAVVVINAALLHRMGLAGLCDQVIFVKAPLLVRYRRCKARQGLSWKAFWARNRAQKDIRVDLLKPVTEVKVFHNRRSRTIIYRQVASYCDTIGLDISAER
ncbi:MAG TPA: dephospho-CoA kinase [Sphaerochaeta sp.]|jgi:dephospho-CoA kinase|nr:dephospho-CoA kinase [Sphaerochaeta sp.]HPZ15423.1 dephospho-CoA kinase [Sphaerochaeta sp.]